MVGRYNRERTLEVRETVMIRQMRANMTDIRVLLVLALIVGTLIGVGCGSSTDGAQPVSTAGSAPTGTGPQPTAPAQPAAPAPVTTQMTIPTPAPVVVTERKGLTGTIEIDGSSTVFPITEAVAEEFRSAAPDVHVNVSVSGSGGGFKRFSTGQIDISDASRPIKESEAAIAAENGIEFFEFLIGVDGLSVMASPDNDFVDCVTVDQLKELWEPGSTVSKWNDLDPIWPDTQIRLYGPGTDSGTFDYFTEEIVGEVQASRADYTASEDDNVLVQGISGDRNSLGYFGYAYYAENADKLKLIEVDAGQGCVKPALDTIASGEYQPLSRPLFIYVNRQRLQERPELRAFVEFYMENGAALTAEVGYVPLSEGAYTANLAVVQSGRMPQTPMVTLKGTIEIDGSSTVFPITEAVAEEFLSVAPNVQINVGVSGSGGGFKRFTVGETDISDASRPIKDSEAAIAAENGISYFEFLVGLDGLSVTVSPQNDFIDCMTVEQLHDLWNPESRVKKWSDLDPSWPSSEIRLYGPGTDSGTFDYFTEEINGEAQASRADYTASEDDNVLVQGISGDRNSLGYFGYAYYAENPDKLKLIGIDDGNGCVKPTLDTIASGTYSPLSRPLFIYVNTASLGRPEVRAFVEFYMARGAQLTHEVGYVPLATIAYQTNLNVVNSYRTGPAFETLAGTIEIDGSSTVFPITEAVAEEFNKVASNIHVNVGVSGSGGGFKRFTVGETDISDASRPIKESEVGAARENGISYFEFPVSVDGLSVMVSPENDFVDCLTVDQLKSLWEPGAAVEKWSDLDPSWPDRKIRLYGPGTDSGTFDYFTEEIVGEAQASRADYTASEDDNVLVRGISGDRNSLGYFGYAYYAENADKLKLIGIDDGNGCVKPSVTTIASGEYTPLSRPLLIYVAKSSLERPEVRAFVEYYMEHGRGLAQEVGYVPLARQDYQANLAELR